MGQLILISGPNDSGKSRFAEQLAAQTTGPRYYIATMEPAVPENYARIEKHRRQRAGLGFVTLELPHGVGDAPVSPDSVVLLEDISNLLANALFSRDGSAAEVLEDLTRLQSRCKLLIAVTIGGLSSEGYDGETAGYIDALNELNDALFARASGAARMQDHQPLWQKGGLHGLA